MLINYILNEITSQLKHGTERRFICTTLRLSGKAGMIPRWHNGADTAWNRAA